MSRMFIRYSRVLINLDGNHFLDICMSGFWKVRCAICNAMKCIFFNIYILVRIRNTSKYVSAALIILEYESNQYSVL